MTLQQSIQVCFSKYTDFSGRASRPEYRWFVLLPLIGPVVLPVWLAQPARATTAGAPA